MFLPKELSVMAYANGITLWNYVTLDSRENILNENYFQSLSNIVNAGDKIQIVIFSDKEKENVIKDYIEVIVTKVEEKFVEIKLLKGLEC